MLAPGISVSSTICCLSLQLQRRRRSTVITSARCIVLQVRLSLLLEPSHPSPQGQGGVTEPLRSSSPGSNCSSDGGRLRACGNFKSIRQMRELRSSVSGLISTKKRDAKRHYRCTSVASNLGSCLGTREP